MRRVKLEDIVWVAERGKRYIIPERESDWMMTCLKNASSKKSVSAMIDLLSVLRMLNDADMTAEKIGHYVDLDQYIWSGNSWMTYQICKYSPKGEEFVKSAKLPCDKKTEKLIEQVVEENSHFESQIKKAKR